jgi:hypothetical protein
MCAVALDALAHRAAEGVSRRRSLMTLGGVGLASALTGPLSAGAKKPGKKQANKRCKRQVAPCATTVQAECDENDTKPDRCAEVIACCDFFARCNAGGFLACTSAAN